MAIDSAHLVMRGRPAGVVHISHNELVKGIGFYDNQVDRLFYKLRVGCRWGGEGWRKMIMQYA